MSADWSGGTSAMLPIADNEELSSGPWRGGSRAGSHESARQDRCRAFGRRRCFALWRDVPSEKVGLSSCGLVAS